MLRQGKYEEAIPRLEDTIEVVFALRLWYPLSSIFYCLQMLIILSLYEKAIEYYYRIIEIEKEKNF